MSKKENKELEVSKKQEIDKNSGEPTREGNWYIPEVDIMEEPDKIVLYADVPGTLKENIQINIHDGQLTLTAPVKALEDRFRAVYNEYEVGGYTRQFTLGEKVDQEKISASLDNGVLTLELPKAAEAQPRKIEVS